MTCESIYLDFVKIDLNYDLSMVCDMFPFFYYSRHYLESRMQNTFVNPSSEIQVPLNVRAPLRGGVILGLVGTILLGLGVCALSGIDVLDMSIETAKVLCGAGVGSMVAATGLVKYGMFKAKEHEELFSQQIHVNYGTFSDEDSFAGAITPELVRTVFEDILTPKSSEMEWKWVQANYFSDPETKSYPPAF